MPRLASLAAGACLALTAAEALAQAPPRAGETFDYRVEAGDTLVGLHARLLRPQADWRVVQRLNRIADPRRLQPGSMLRIPLPLLREQAASAEVLHAHGEVFVERAGAAREALRPAALLRSGDLVTTGAQSSASLRFEDGSRALLGPNGRLRVESHVRFGPGGPLGTTLQLQSGGVETSVQPARPAPRFELRTPVANLGVRGTEFRARLDGDRLLAETLTGRVAVGPVAVDAGFGTVATPAGVAAPRALLPAPDLAGMPRLVERLPLSFDFGAVAGAARYRAQLFDTGEPARLLLEGLFEQPRVAWPDSPPDGRYELRLRAADGSGVEGHAARLDFTLKARPEPPFQLRPRAGENLIEEAVRFAWSAHPEGVRYRLQVAAQRDFSAPLLERSDLTGTEFSAALPLGTWYWRLATVRAAGDSGPWGDAATLVRAAPPPPPPVPAVEPPKVDAAGLVMRWAAAAQPGWRYQVQVARDAAFTQLVLDETTEATERLLPDPQPGTYHLRVRSVASDGRSGSFGAAQVIEIPRSLWWLWLLPLLLLL